MRLAFPFHSCATDLLRRDKPVQPARRVMPTDMNDDHWYGCLLGAPPSFLPPGNPARDTNRRNR
jgi:hypothetical protein